jgi:hypothetical protein
MPPVPMPKARAKARYSIVIINEAGQSRQIELTPVRMRIGIGAIAAVVCLFVVMSILAVGSFSGRSTVAARDDGTSGKLKALQEELGKKELALAVLEKRLKEAEESPALAVAAPKPLTEPSDLATAGVLQQSSETDTRVSAASPGIEEEFDLQHRSGAQATAPKQTAQRESSAQFQTEAGEGQRQPPVNFNAEAVTASAETTSNGTLSFRLIKDQPTVQFAGFLFVFLEMVDQKGETKIYAYPERTRIGDGDLPANYKDGKDLAFKYNCRIELPYSDMRQGAKLERVSILLYGENGKIVFQRGFDSNEVKVITAKNAAPDATRTKSANKRRAL